MIREVSVDKSSDDRNGAVLFDHLDSSHKMVWPVFQALSEWRQATERPSDKRRFRLSGKRACLMAWSTSCFARPAFSLVPTDQERLAQEADTLVSTLIILLRTSI